MQFEVDGGTLKDVITTVAAFLGAGLGIINTWNTISSKKVGLKIKPAHAIPVGDMARIYGENLLSIEVVNLSSFPVVIDEVGLTIQGSAQRAAIVRPILIDGGEWPRKLAPHESVTAYSSRPQPGGPKIGKAYARTTSGVRAYGTSSALKQMRDEALGR